MKILGIYDGHNASVALLENGEITFALQEERPTNIKNFFGFPQKALDYLFKNQNLKPADIDLVALSSFFISSPMEPEEVRKHFNWQGTPLAIFVKKISKLSVVQKLREKQSLSRRFRILKKLGFKKEKICVIDHHFCHAASAYYGLAQEYNKKYLVLTLDGGGDWLCSTVNIGYLGKIKKIAQTPYGHSLGDIYARTTFMMGFTPWEHEYKLMGMAPYANKNYSEKVKEIYKKYLDFDSKNPLIFRKKIFEDTNHIVKRLEHDLRRVRFDNICGGLQMFTEELLVKWIKACIKKTGIKDLLCAGGIFMNVKANKLISELSEVDSISIFPSCSDESTSLGAAWLLYHQKNPQEKLFNLKDYYLGPSFSEENAKEEIENARKKISFSFTKENNINKKITELLVQGKIVARCSGRMEFGARALGNRSILVDPKNLQVVSVINKMIKNRDFWMPFAPVVKKDKTNLYLKNEKKLSSPYMMMAFDTTDKKNDFIAAIHNADFTARAQIIEPNQSPDLENILDEFEKITGRAILLNTSFNLHGYPIVFGPKEAIWTFENSGLEYLAIGDFLLSKQSL